MSTPTTPLDSPRRFASFCRLARLFAALLSLVCFALAADAPKKNFDVPADVADRSLKRFSEQAGLEVIFPSEIARGVRTQPVKGTMTPREALAGMLASTGLTVIRDEKTGSLTVSRGVDPNAQRAAPVVTSDRPASNSVQSDEAIKLSPFVVNSDKDVGYAANSSLAGSRLNTPLRDTGASISVMTAEFLSDVGANDLPEAVQWANNVQMEVVDVAANDNNTLMNFPNFRVRGIAASVTRNYFTWRLSTDGYNVDRIEEQRGPNSILFGIGSAGGILNSGTKRASPARDFRRASVQAGSFGSFRGTMDLNQRALDGRVAVRLNAVYGHAGSHRHHAFNDSRRVHVAGTFKATPKTTFRAEYEVGDIDQVTSRTFNVTDGMLAWQGAGAVTVAAPVAANAALGLGNYGTATRVTFIGNSSQLFNMAGRNVSQGSNQVVPDALTADRSINTGGPGQKRFGDFNTVSLFAERQLGVNTFVELSYNHQKQFFTAYVAGQGTAEPATLRADPNRFLPNGQPNPFVGRLMFEGPRANRVMTGYRSDDTRLMLSHEQDFGRWGNYRLAALGEYEWRAATNHIQTEAWADRAFAGSNQGPETATNLVYRRSYVTTGDWSTYYINGPAERGLIQNMVEPVTGRTLSSTWVNFNAGKSDDPEYQKTLLLGGQARYWDGRLVAGLGFRQDWLSVTKRAVTQRAATATGVPGEFGQFYNSATFEDYTSRTRTSGLVAHLHRQVSAFVNTSNSFSLPNTGIRVLPHGGIPPKPQATGMDAGFMFTLFSGRVNARVNAYRVNLLQSADFRFGGTSSNPRELARIVLSALVRNNLMTQAEMDARFVDSTGATFDRKAEGYEMTLTANPTKNWRLQLNYSYTTGYESNIGPEVKAWAAKEIPFYLRYASVPTDSAGATIGTVVAAWQAVAADTWELEGVAMSGNRPHKLSLFSRYSVPSGWLRGAYFGGGYRYVSKSQLGLDAAGALRRGNSYWLADFLAGYRLQRVPFLKRDLTFQLNVANLFDWRTPIITRFTADNVISRWNILEPRTWRLNANVEF